MNTKQLVQYIDELLNIAAFNDYAPNGLQIEGRENVKHIVLAVSISQQLIDYAVSVNADAICVHHGFFWKGESSLLIGMKKQRIKSILSNEINVLAYHLPLDAHAELGNNAQLAKLLNLTNAKPTLQNFLWTGEIQSKQIKSFKTLIANVLAREPLVINENVLNNLIEQTPESKTIKIAWCSGASQDDLVLAKQLGAMIYLSGEISERNYYEAIENNICYISAGHYATEQFGIKSLGQHLTDKFQIKTEFFVENNCI